jgi:probable HAF family extracellular repeat protein
MKPGIRVSARECCRCYGTSPSLPSHPSFLPFSSHGISKKACPKLTKSAGEAPRGTPIPPISPRSLDAGEIVGAAAFPNALSDAYLWKNGVARDLGVLSGDCSSEAKAINSRREVVGVSVSCDGSNWRAFLWEDGAAVDLNTLVPADSSLELAYPLAISEDDSALGLCAHPGEQFRGSLMPMPAGDIVRKVDLGEAPAVEASSVSLNLHG